MDNPDPKCIEQSAAIDLLLTPKSKDLGGLSVRRVLPASEARSVGPFVFFDEMGPARFPPGEGINVRPHPHIGLATVTFLFEGEILHRDSLGYVQAIEPGAVNLMTAGSGIVHSERTSEERLANGQALHGIQVWMALPDNQQEIEPAFVHHPKTDLPVIREQGVTTTVIIGTYQGRQSPVSVLPETVYLNQDIEAGTSTELAALASERGVYLVGGDLSIQGCPIDTGSMAVINEAATPELTSSNGAHLLLIGGAPMSRRHLWWNFVHSDRDRIEQAKQAWKNGEFGLVPGDDEFIPLPE